MEGKAVEKMAFSRAVRNIPPKREMKMTQTHRLWLAASSSAGWQNWFPSLGRSWASWLAKDAVFRWLVLLMARSILPLGNELSLRDFYLGQRGEYSFRRTTGVERAYVYAAGCPPMLGSGGRRRHGRYDPSSQTHPTSLVQLGAPRVT